MFTIEPMYVASVSPLKTHVGGKPHWKTKAKYRKDGTMKKVVTKAKRGSGNPESRSWLQGVFGKNNYKSVIKFDKEGKIKSAKNNRTKNKHKKSPQRTKRSKWIARDLTPYNDPSSIVRKNPEMFNNGKKYVPKVQKTVKVKDKKLDKGLGPAFSRN